MLRTQEELESVAQFRAERYYHESIKHQPWIAHIIFDSFL